MSKGRARLLAAVAALVIAMVGSLVALQELANHLHKGTEALVEQSPTLSAPYAAPFDALPQPSAVDSQPADSGARAVYVRVVERMRDQGFPPPGFRILLRVLETEGSFSPELAAEWRDFFEAEAPFFALAREACAAVPSDLYSELSRIRTLVSYLYADALYRAAVGETETYAADMAAILRLVAGLADESDMVLQYNRYHYARRAFAVAVAHETLASALTPAQIGQIQQETREACRKPNIAAALSHAVQEARRAFDEVREQGLDSMYELRGIYDSTTPDRRTDQIFQYWFMAGDAGIPASERARRLIYHTPVGAYWVSADERALVEHAVGLIAVVEQPYYRAQAFLPSAEQIAKLPPSRRVTREVIPWMQDALVQQAEIEAMMGLICVGLEVECYQAETGSVPPDLYALQDRLEGGDCLDPFTGVPYVYRPSDNSFQLYSVGVNLTDDGGTPDPREGDIVWRGKEKM